jgi:hypothetical protein
VLCLAISSRVNIGNPSVNVTNKQSELMNNYEDIPVTYPYVHHGDQECCEVCCVGECCDGDHCDYCDEEYCDSCCEDCYDEDHFQMVEQTDSLCYKHSTMDCIEM